MGKTLHRKKLFGGRRTAEEIHQQYAFPLSAKCGGCGRRPLTRAISMAPLDEARKRYPEVDALMDLDPNELVKRLVQLKGSDGKATPYIRLGITYACKSCTPEMERSLAKLPSWVVAEINRGPGVDKVITSG